MTDAEIMNELCNAINRSLLLSGKQPIANPDITLQPILDIEGLDSQMGIEITLELEETLGKKLADNIFIKDTDKKPKARSFAEIVAYLSRVVKGSNG